MKMYRVFLAAGLLSTAALAHAQVDQVKVWAAACANCHGTNGYAQNSMESLAGKDEDELVQKLMDFKAGRKPATIMHHLTKGYSDDELKAIAAYFAAQKK